MGRPRKENSPIRAYWRWAKQREKDRKQHLEEPLNVDVPKAKEMFQVA